MIPGFDSGVGKIPWRRERLPTTVFRPGEFHGLYRVAKSGTQLSSFHFIKRDKGSLFPLSVECVYVSGVTTGLQLWGSS